jgi:hypothetical protein
MSESEDRAGSAPPPLKRSVFRSDILQREIERREGSVTLEGVPRIHLFVLVGWTIVLLLAIGSLLAAPVTLSAGFSLKDTPIVTGAGQNVHLLLMTKDSRQLVRGSVLVVKTLRGVQPVDLEVENVVSVSGEAGTGSTDAVLAVTARAKNALRLPNGRLDVGPSHEVALRVHFIECLAALLKAK